MLQIHPVLGLIFKRCTICQRFKDASQYGGASLGLYGLRAQCRECQRAERTSPEGSRQAVARVARWRLANREKARAMARLAAQRHTQRRNQYRASTGYADVRRRRAMKKGATSHHTQAEWLALVEFFGGVCLRCLSADRSLQRDHVTPLSRGGDDGIDNLQPLCGPCNNGKGTKEIDYRT